MATYSFDTNDTQGLITSGVTAIKAIRDLQISEDEVVPVTGALGHIAVFAGEKALYAVAADRLIGDAEAAEPSEVIQAMADGTLADLEEKKAIPWLLVAQFIFQMIQLFRKR